MNGEMSSRSVQAGVPGPVVVSPAEPSGWYVRYVNDDVNRSRARSRGTSIMPQRDLDVERERVAARGEHELPFAGHRAVRDVEETLRTFLHAERGERHGPAREARDDIAVGERKLGVDRERRRALAFALFARE